MDKNLIKELRAWWEHHFSTLMGIVDDEFEDIVSRMENTPVEAKATAEGSLVEYPCPTCGAERFKTERRINGDSWCRFGHKHPTKDFVRPASPAVEELVRELRQWAKECGLEDEPEIEDMGKAFQDFDAILAKYYERGQAK